MGAMVVLFSGIIGLLVYQNKTSDRATQISQVRESRPSVDSQTSNIPSVSSNSSLANTNANSSAVSPIENLKQTGVSVGSANVASAPADAEKNQQAVDATSGVSVQSEPKLGAAPPIVAAQPPPAAKALELPVNGRNVAGLKVENERDKKKDETAASADEVIAQNAQNNDQRASREMSPNAKSSTNRAAGPRQVQSQTQTQNQIQNLPQGGVALMSSLRTAGGKKFELRDGIWYDTSYTGQGKKDVKRGTEKFLRLDAGLRSIADQIGGTVVVVWNGQAYKIK